MHVEAAATQLVQCGVLVAGVPEHDGVDDEPEGAELVFLPFAVALAELTSLAVEDCSGQGVPAFGAIELGEDAPTVGFVVQVGEQVEGFGYPAEFGDGPAERRWSAAALQDAKKFGGPHGAGGKAAGTVQQVVPVRGDEVGVDLVAGEAVERTVVGGAVDAPEPGGADVGQAGAELVAEQPNRPKTWSE